MNMHQFTLATIALLVVLAGGQSEANSECCTCGQSNSINLDFGDLLSGGKVDAITTSVSDLVANTVRLTTATSGTLLIDAEVIVVQLIRGSDVSANLVLVGLVKSLSSISAELNIDVNAVISAVSGLESVLEQLNLSTADFLKGDLTDLNNVLAALDISALEFMQDISLALLLEYSLNGQKSVTIDVSALLKGKSVEKILPSLGSFIVEKLVKADFTLDDLVANLASLIDQLVEKSKDSVEVFLSKLVRSLEKICKKLSISVESVIDFTPGLTAALEQLNLDVKTFLKGDLKDIANVLEVLDISAIQLGVDINVAIFLQLQLTLDSVTTVFNTIGKAISKL